ncbi:MAG: type II toxin-antitoxin system VapC family toxin [Ilumatobacteraceae bacterium]
MAFYLETSAVVKLVVAEVETAALTAWIAAEQNVFVSCDLLRTELFRVVRRGAPESVTRARHVVNSISIMTVPTTTFEHTGELTPQTLRSLDAIHLAAALELGDDLDGLVTYDGALAAAAATHGITVVAPGS